MKTSALYHSIKWPLLATLALTQPLTGAILFQDDFSGLSSDPLNGTTPDITVGATAWSAISDYAADGTVTGVSRGSVGRAASLGLGTLIDDNRGNANAIYTLSASLNVLETTSATWEAVGFWPVTAPADNLFYASGNAWMLRRGNGNLRVFRGPSTAAGLTENGASPNDVLGEVDVQIILDLSSWNGSSNYGTVTYSAKLPSDPTYTEIASGPLAANNSSFQAVGFGGGDVDAKLSFFEFSQVPEPSTAALLAGVLPLLLRRRRA